MASTILFVLEGENIEPKILESYEKYFNTENTVLKCIYGTVIYNLYSKISTDDTFDTLTLLKEYAKIKEELIEYEVDDISDIFFFFDYDGHSSSASDAKLDSLLNLFDDSFGAGKLYLSYPMAESLKHYSPEMNFQDLKFDISKSKGYKGIVKKECSFEYEHVHLYKRDTWNLLIKIHLNKMNYIVNNSYTFPSNDEKNTPKELFDKQLEKYITPDNTVAVISAFPMFIFDYYLYEKLLELLE